MNKILFAVLLIIGGFTANEPQNERLLIIYNGCKEGEAKEDLKLSVYKNITFLQTNKIKLRFEKKSPCGYKLVIGKKIKIIKSVLTDVDLAEELKAFYNL